MFGVRLLVPFSQMIYRDSGELVSVYDMPVYLDYSVFLHFFLIYIPLLTTLTLDI
jgi:hypothetical protein